MQPKDLVPDYRGPHEPPETEAPLPLWPRRERPLCAL